MYCLLPPPHCTLLSWAVVWNCAPSPFSPPLHVLGMTSVCSQISCWLVRSVSPGCKMNPILAKPEHEFIYFFIAFPFSFKCLNPLFWKNLGICLLMKTGLPAYKTLKKVTAGRLSVSGAMCYYNVKTRGGWRQFLYSQSVYKWNIPAFWRLSFILKGFFHYLCIPEINSVAKSSVKF